MGNVGRSISIRTTTTFVVASIVLCVLSSAVAAQAHSLRVFASASGETITGRVYYDGNLPAAGAKVRIQSPAGSLVGELTTSVEGRFSYTVQYRADYRIIAETADLHRAETTVRSTAFSSKLPSIEVVPHIRQIVEDATEEQLRGETSNEFHQLKEQMDRLESTIRLRDILGGIGIILGVLAIVYFLKGRQS